MEPFSPERFSLLIVDDIGYNLQLLETILERAKYRVVRATNGERALEQIERKVPDLILLDLMMPGMDGLQVCRILKANARYREIPIIFLTANNESKNLIEAFGSGAVDYITKPFNVLELLARVKTHLELKHAKDQLQQALRDLEQLVLTDPLTRVSNRRHLYRVAEMEIARTRGYQYPFSVLLLDIDRFKQVNDTYGHLVGDEVLQSVASLVKNILRQEDCLARFGGEEFVVLLPHTDSSGAIAAADRIRRLIASSSIVIGGKPISVTASIGVATFQFDDRDLDDLLNRADEALLNAKRQGRDRCVLHLANLDNPAIV